MPSGTRSFASLNKHTIRGLKNANNGTFTCDVDEDILRTSGLTFQTGYTATECLVCPSTTTLDSLTPDEILKSYAASPLAVSHFNENITSINLNGHEYASSSLDLSLFDYITKLGGIHKKARLTLKPTGIAVAAGTASATMYPVAAGAAVGSAAQSPDSAGSAFGVGSAAYVNSVSWYY